MPLPSSLTLMVLRPPSSSAMSIIVAPASIAFSTSSFTTEEGRSTTSPAAIWSATELGRIEITGIATAKLPILAPRRSGDILFLVLTLNVGLLVFRRVQDRLRLLWRHARHGFGRLRLDWTRRRVRALALPSTTASSTTAPSSSPSAAATPLLLTKCELIVPARIRVGDGHFKNLFVAEQRAIELRVGRIFRAAPLHQIVEAKIESRVVPRLEVLGVGCFREWRNRLLQRVASQQLGSGVVQRYSRFVAWDPAA